MLSLYYCGDVTRLPLMTFRSANSGPILAASLGRLNSRPLRYGAIFGYFGRGASDARHVGREILRSGVNLVAKNDFSVGRAGWKPQRRMPRMKVAPQMSKRMMSIKSSPTMDIKSVLNGSVQEGETVMVRGWVRTVRKQKKYCFFSISDGSCADNIQIVAFSNSTLGEIDFGSSVIVTGVVARNERNNGAMELSCCSSDDSSLKLGIRLVGECDPLKYPLQKKWHSPEYARQLVHLRSRTQRIGSILRIRSSTTLEIHKFFDERGFVNIHCPILSSVDCEGAGEMFKVADPFQEDTTHYLTVSGQLHAEIFATSHTKVYSFGPIFRAENSNTSRHLNEFYMLEPEVAFHSLEDSMELAEDCLKTVISRVLERNADDFRVIADWNTKQPSKDKTNYTGLDKAKLMEADLLTAREKSFAHISYTDALDVLERKLSARLRWGMPLQVEHENYLCETYCNRTPVFVTDYPASCKPFYMKKRSQGNLATKEADTVNCFDLIVPRLGELIGGSEREDNFEILRKATETFGANRDGKLDWYLDLRRFGTVPHSGWGLGLERFVQFLTGTENIRDSIPIPRTPYSFPC